jgi:hypothetical protein
MVVIAFFEKTTPKKSKWRQISLLSSKIVKTENFTSEK